MQAINEKIGYNISMYRKRKGLSQHNLSELTGISRSSISNMENGRHTVTIPTMIKICQCLGCVPDQILSFAFTEAGTPNSMTISDDDLLRIKTSGDPCVCKGLSDKKDDGLEMSKGVHDTVQRLINQHVEDTARIKQLEESIRGIIKNPYGCPFCDSGVLRNEDRDHWPECSFKIAADSLITLDKDILNIGNEDLPLIP